MGATFSRVKTWVSEVLTASDLNAEFNNILTNLTPAGVDDTSGDTSAMQTVTDPYPGSVESKATSLEGELHRIRYVIKQITGESQWYIDPDSTIAALVSAAAGYATLTGAEVLTNKTLTSPVINTGVSGTAIVDEDTMVSDSATLIPTQQSVKAYVDNTVQIAQELSGALVSGNTAIPYDDTIPQITEGVLFLSKAFTPKLATSKLRIDVTINFSQALNNTSIIALFNGGTPAIACHAVTTGTTDIMYNTTFSYVYSPGSTNPITFSVRGGTSDGAVIAMNGTASGTPARKLGGKIASSLTITELRS